MTSNQTDTEATISAENRASILRYASNLLPLRYRQADAVLAEAEPLLEWAGRATGQDDLRARMDAMNQANLNGCLRPRTPQEYLEEARGYYQFIIARG